MGIILVLRRVSQQAIDNILMYPEEIRWFLLGESRPRSFFQKLFNISDPPPKLKWEEPTQDEETDLDKAWHGLHYLLTETAYEGEAPACYLLEGGQLISNEEICLGPGRILRVSETQAFHQYLQSISEEVLKSRFKPKKMQELKIYPEIYGTQEEDHEILDYLIDYFNTLKSFVALAAEQQQGLIIYFT